MINKVILVGNLGADPEYKDVGGGMLRLSIATNERWKNKDTGEYEERTEWHWVTYFSKGAHKLQDYLHRGSRVYVEGKLQTRSWETDSGDKRYSTEVKAYELKLLDRKGDGGSQKRSGTSPARHPEDDDIPF